MKHKVLSLKNKIFLTAALVHVLSQFFYKITFELLNGYVLLPVVILRPLLLSVYFTTILVR